MNLKNRIILEDYRKSRDVYLQLEEVIDKRLHDIIKSSGIKQILGIEHRVKTEHSLAGKLERSGDYYNRLEELTDLLGARIICYFSDEVDIIGKLVEQSFVIDWEMSSDKRSLLEANRFGYLSLHYICSLPEDGTFPAQLCGLKFEIQIRTVLQHAWAAIEHDIGYKNEFGVPRAIVREFSRLAGLFEIADDEFVRLRDNMRNYTEGIREKIINNEADDIPIDTVSLNEYVHRNKKMKSFLSELARIAGADIEEVNPESYVEQLRFMGKHTLGDLQIMLSENRELAVKMVRTALEGAKLDIVSSSVGLRYLCRAELINKGYSIEKTTEFIALTVKDNARAERQAGYLIEKYKKEKDKDER